LKLILSRILIAGLGIIFSSLVAEERMVVRFVDPDKTVLTEFNETDYERLYTFIRHNIRTRSMLMVYTNFEHINSLKRQLPFLKKLAKKHLVVVIIFENSELVNLIDKKVSDTQTLYHKIIANDFYLQKRMMVKELKLHNIQTILTPPEHLTSAAINKYLQLKSRGMI